MKKVIALLLGLAMILSLAACGKQAKTPAVDQITVGTTAVIEKAVISEYNYEMLASAVTHLPLVWQDTEGNFHPLLASFSTEDAKTWTYTIEEGMKWSDGEPVTAEDILFTLQYEDENGMGIGGWPEGIVISEGELRMGYPGGTYDVYGLTDENVLVVGRMTAQQALDIGVRDAVSFGPALIVNGVAAKYSGAGGGLNPRTAIGQREDGAILLLVIEGRKTSSMGATMADLIKVMQDYGAVNAANLDGGMSSAMWLYDDELVSSSSIRVSRQMPTAFIILPQKDGSAQGTEG